MSNLQLQSLPFSKLQNAAGISQTAAHILFLKHKTSAAQVGTGRHACDAGFASQFSLILLSLANSLLLLEALWPLALSPSLLLHPDFSSSLHLSTRPPLYRFTPPPRPIQPPTSLYSYMLALFPLQPQNCRVEERFMGLIEFYDFKKCPHPIFKSTL